MPEAPDHLIKYCKAETAEQILNSHSLRWSSPALFEDPFELPAVPNVGFDNDSLLNATVKLASSMLFSSDAPKGDSPIINAIKRWREEERFSSPDEAHDILRELLNKMVEHRAEQLNETMGKWQAFIRNIRMCSFCSKPDNLTAWEKYGDWHKGIAIRFAVNSESAAARPKEVTYQVEPARLTTLKEQLGCIVYNKKDSIVTRFKEQYFNKGPHHKLEKEWRCVQSSKDNTPISNETPSDWIDDISFRKNEIEAVYFGLNTPEDSKKRISSIIKENYKNVKLFQIIRAKNGYILEAEKLAKL